MFWNATAKMTESCVASVIIPTWNRSRLLARTLTALAAQTAESRSFEVVVVDNGSSDDTIQVIQRAALQYGNLQIRWLTESRQGPGSARNRGITHATGEYILFTDDDCLPEEDWIEAILRPFSEKPGLAGVEGLTYTYLQEFSPFVHFAASCGGVYPTCNMAYRARWLRDAGGFDAEAFPACSAEDVDVARRLLTYGSIAFAATARVHHPPRPVGFWWQVKRGHHLWRDALSLRVRYPRRADRRGRSNGSRVSPACRLGSTWYLTSLQPMTARQMLFRRDLICRPTLYAAYCVMLMLRALFGIAVLPGTLVHVYRHRNPAASARSLQTDR